MLCAVLESGKVNASMATGKSGEAMWDGFTSDYRILQRILPGEVWILVADKLRKRSTETVEYLANSLEFFQNLLASQRTSYLFEKVFPLVAASVWKKEGLEGLPVSDVLKCRGVCKHWNVAIDNLVAGKFQYFGKGSRDNQVAAIGNAFKLIVSDNEFWNLTPDEDDEPKKTIADFLKHFELTHPGNQREGRNPWIWGNFSIEIFSESEIDDNVEDYAVFLERVSTLLSKHGSHLQSFSVTSADFVFFWNASLLQTWLELMPNLKKFCYQSEFPWEPMDNSAKMNLEEAVKVNPFPKLKFLESLHFENLPLPMVNGLLEQNNHVSELSLFDLDIIRDDILLVGLPNLKSLEIKHFIEENKDDFVQKIGSPQIKWRLETLKFELRGRPVDCTALFQMIKNKFAETLVSLSIEMNDNARQHWQSCKNCRLDLPKHRKIRIVLNGIPVCLDFLLPMRHNLEEISVSFGYEVPLSQNILQTNGNIVQIYGFEEKMLESNIWAIFKKLERIEVNKCLREDALINLREDWMIDNVYA